MTTKAQKKKRSNSGSSHGKARKRQKIALDEDGGNTSPATKTTKPMAERVGKNIEERLVALESKPKRRTKPSRKSSPSRTRKPRATPAKEDAEVPVKRLRSSVSRDSEKATEKIGAKEEKGILEQLFSLIPGARGRDYDKLIDTLQRMDEFGKVPDVDNKLEALMTFLYEKYWRVETTGLENIPNDGRTLIVSNHSGVLPFDGAMMATAIYKFHPAKRHARFLIEDWFGQLPFATAFMNAVGQVRACQENAERLLRQEQLVGVFPEGIKGMAKGFKNRYNLARFGRGGVIRLAIRTRSPVIPCAVVGAEEIYIVLGYANWLGKMVGMPLLPITPTFPWLGLLGVIPMPTKWYIQFGEMISYDEYDDSALKDNVIINRLNRQLRATIQETVDSLLKKRRSLFF